MILSVMGMIGDNMLPLSFISHVLIFLGGYYVALHSRSLPTWAVTCLWYIGLCSLINLSTIIAQWVYGEDFFLSYVNVSVITETLLNMVIAATVVVCLSDTVLKDFKGMRSRKKSEKFEI